MRIQWGSDLMVASYYIALWQLRTLVAVNESSEQEIDGEERVRMMTIEEE